MKRIALVVFCLISIPCIAFGQASLERSAIDSGSLFYRLSITNGTFTYTNDSASVAEIRSVSFTDENGTNAVMTADFVRRVDVVHLYTNFVSTNIYDEVVTNSYPIRWVESAVWTDRVVNVTNDATAYHFESFPDGESVLKDESVIFTWTGHIDPIYMTITVDTPEEE